jgi:HEPN domain-containing protein
MSGTPEGTRAVLAWFEKAQNDLRNAEHTLTLEEGCPVDTVCFHAQQCAEKCLKALLLSSGVDFPKTHDLRALMQLLPPGTAVGVEIEELLSLNRYSVEARYPGDWEPITREQAEEAVGIARRLREAVRAQLLG